MHHLQTVKQIGRAGIACSSVMPDLKSLGDWVAKRVYVGPAIRLLCLPSHLEEKGLQFPVMGVRGRLSKG